jgi:hypothetical protein
VAEVVPWDDDEDVADGWCECGLLHTIEEIHFGQCDYCGNPISPEEYP